MSGITNSWRDVEQALFKGIEYLDPRMGKLKFWHDALWTKSQEYDYDKTADALVGIEDWDIVTRITLANSLHNPLLAHQWLSTATAPLTGKPTPDWKRRMTPGYVLGVILGSFESKQVNNTPAKNRVVKEITDILTKVLINFCPHSSDQFPKMHIDLPNKEWEGRLANVWLYWANVETVTTVYNGLFRHPSQTDLKSICKNKLGEVLLRKMNHTLFNSVAPERQAEILWDGLLSLST